MNIGILALQGNYQQHNNVLDMLGIQSTLIRHSRELDKCDSLIIPGGESSVISKLLDNIQLRLNLIDFAGTSPILGTCAGMIMLSNTKATDNMEPLNIMDFEVKRNAWGRQANSFSAEINLDFEKNNRSFHAVFIRAPRISRIGKSIKILASYNDEPILISNGIHLASSFHPEFGTDTQIHNYFINLVKENEKINSLRN